ELVEFGTAYPVSLGTIRMDRARFYQVLVNLLDNAMKFTHQGSVILSASEQEAGWLEIRIEDTGVGIEQEELESIFDKFYQTKTQDGLSDKPLGTGLGLTICRRIVDRYDGRIWVESTPGKGSTFIVRLPLARENAKAASGAA
ncbi:MAG: sensor histidine kinase, partial [Oceanidesulfovibrio sp.]